MPPTETVSPPGVLLVADVAALLTDEARKLHDARAADRRWENASRVKRGRKPLPDIGQFREIGTATVLTYLRRFKDTDHPMPEPDGHLGTHRRLPWWSKRREKELRDWYRRRPGHGHGRGGWPAGTPRRAHTPDLGR